MRHYVYVTKGECGRFYIGVRSCEGDPTEDPYMGSHKDPEYSPVEKWIWSEFDTREEAANAEASLHEVLDVAVSQHFVNRAKAAGNSSNYGWKHSEEAKQKMSLARLGENNVSKRPDVRKKISEKLTGNKCALGAQRSPETRAKMAAAKLGDNNPSKRPEIRKKNSEAQKLKRWYYDPKTNESKRITIGDQIPLGYVPGRGLLG